MVVWIIKKQRKNSDKEPSHNHQKKSNNLKLYITPLI